MSAAILEAPAIPSASDMARRILRRFGFGAAPAGGWAAWFERTYEGRASDKIAHKIVGTEIGESRAEAETYLNATGWRRISEWVAVPHPGELAS